MHIRFCEFCSTVHKDDRTHCPHCGTQLVQTVDEDDFNNPNTPWPFVPIEYLQLEIQGKPRMVRFSGTHSVFHFWTELHRAYQENALYFREHRNEMLLIYVPQGDCPDGAQPLDPVRIMESQYDRYSLYTDQPMELDGDQEEVGMSVMYQGSFEIVDCPQRYWKEILGWLVATEPRPALEDDWVYFVT